MRALPQRALGALLAAALAATPALAGDPVARAIGVQAKATAAANAAALATKPSTADVDGKISAAIAPLATSAALTATDTKATAAQSGVATNASDIGALKGQMTTVQGQVTANTAALPGKAAIDSPAFTGMPTVPTPAPRNASTQAANALFVTQSINLRAPPTLQGAGAVADGATDASTAVQAAVTALGAAGGGNLVLQPGQMMLGAPISLVERGNLSGYGKAASNLIATSANTGWMLRYLTGPSDNTERWSPTVRDLTAQGGSIIQINDKAQPFTGTSSPTQAYQTQPQVMNTSLRATTIGSGTGIQITKGFRTYLAQNLVYGFQTCLDLNGSDIGLVQNNRFAACGREAVLDTSYDTYGSQNAYFANDFTGFGSSTTAIFRMSNRNPEILYNYLEVPGTTALPAGSSVFEINDNISGANSGSNAFPQSILIQGNRLDVSGAQASYALKLNTAAWASLVYEHNRSIKTSPLVSLFPSNPTYWYNTAVRRSIFWRNNNFGNDPIGAAGGPPFVTQDESQLTHPSVVSFTSSTQGLSPASNGTAVTVGSDGAFQLYYSSTTNENQFSSPLLAGLVKAHVWILAKGASAGDTLYVQVRSGTTSPVNGVTIPLTTDYQWYKVFGTPQIATDFRVYVLPGSVNGTDLVSLKEIKVERVGANTRDYVYGTLANWAPGMIPGLSSVTKTMTVTGAIPSDKELNMHVVGQTAGIIVTGEITSSDTVTLRASNVTNTMVTPYQMTVYATAVKVN